MQLTITMEDTTEWVVGYSEMARMANYIFFYTLPMQEFLNGSLITTLKNVTISFLNEEDQPETLDVDIEAISYATDHGRLAFKIKGE